MGAELDRVWRLLHILAGASAWSILPGTAVLVGLLLSEPRVPSRRAYSRRRDYVLQLKPGSYPDKLERSAERKEKSSR